MENKKQFDAGEYETKRKKLGKKEPFKLEKKTSTSVNILLLIIRMTFLVLLIGFVRSCIVPLFN